MVGALELLAAFTTLKSISRKFLAAEIMLFGRTNMGAQIVKRFCYFKTNPTLFKFE